MIGPGASPRLILASASPRRAELLTRLGLTFDVVPSDIPEDGLDGEAPAAHAERLSREKAMKVSEAHPDALVLAGDTVVVREGALLGKPRDVEEAVAMLSSLSGRSHRVISGLALIFPDGRIRSGSLTTEVTFRPFDEAFARRYAETGEPLDKAGAYGIQGLGSALVKGIRGDYHTVMGLPLPLFLDLLREEGWRYEFGELVRTDPDMPAIHPGIPLPVRWSDDGSAIRLLDQTLLPGEERYLRLETVEAVAEAISSLRVRGAPAIGITAALGLAMGSRHRIERRVGKGEPEGLEWGFQEDLELLLSTRPTAVNLPWALDRLARVFAETTSEGDESQVEALTREANAIAREDQEMCRLIGEHGVELIPEEGAGVLTHCNAGALATGGMGTALAPIYTAHARGIPIRLYADETRPLLQGARLTAWEAARIGVETTVVTDSMAGVLMGEGRVDLVIVGADRVAANGDVANKIGTYGVAVLARHHGIPFYVALPRSTFDPLVSEGREIPIEERDPSEVGRLGGQEVVPPGVPVWNPAFDITPAHLVTAFITDGGVLRPPFGTSIADLLGAMSSVDGSGNPTPEEKP